MATKEEKRKRALLIAGIPGIGALLYLLFRKRVAAGDDNGDDNGNGNGDGNGVVGLTIERFFVLNNNSVTEGDFDVHCHIRNTGDTEASGLITLIGQVFIKGGQGVLDINETEQVTIQPGEVYDYVYGGASYRDDQAWVQASGDWGEITPALAFQVGFGYGSAGPEGELVATDVGSDYAIVRYAQDSEFDRWDFYCRTPPPPATREHSVRFPTLRLPHSKTSIYHLIPGLWSGRTYYAKGTDSREGVTTFTTGV